jgi:hypothetical protein
MEERVAATLIHFYDVRQRETLCGLRGFEHRSTKHARSVTCPACVGLLHERLAPDVLLPAGTDHGSAAGA